MKNSKGFSLIEVLVTFTVIFIIATSIIPTISLLNNELEVLSQRRKFTNYLHDELQTYLWSDTIEEFPISYSETLESTDVFLNFIIEDSLIKGCVEWKNVKQRRERFCLYGFQQK